jgi:hypothetical protein
MPLTFSNYILQLSESLDAQDGLQLAYLLRPTGPHSKDLLKEFRNPTVCPFHRPRTCFQTVVQFESLAYYQGSIESPWDEIAIRYVLVAGHIAKKRSMEAFKEHTTFVSLVFHFDK